MGNKFLMHSEGSDRRVTGEPREVSSEGLLQYQLNTIRKTTQWHDTTSAMPL